MPSLAFKSHVAHESITDDHIGLAVEDVAALNVADEVDGQGFEERKSFAGKLVALGFFLADGKKADSGPRDLENAAGIHLAHHGELFEVLRFAVDVSADVKKHAGITL